MSKVKTAIFPARTGAYIVWEKGYEDPLYIGQAGSSAKVYELEDSLIEKLRPRLNVGGPRRVLETSEATIASRWQKQHMKPRAGGSALRAALGPYLGLVEERLNRRRDGRHYPTEIEAAITRFLEECSIEFRFCE